jgi:hypothetical protein
MHVPFNYHTSFSLSGKADLPRSTGPSFSDDNHAHCLPTVFRAELHSAAFIFFPLLSQLVLNAAKESGRAFVAKKKLTKVKALSHLLTEKRVKIYNDRAKVTQTTR